MENATAVPASVIDKPPSPIASDYAELVSLISLFIVGAPLNLAAYTQVRALLRGSAAPQLTERPTHTRLDILKRHLNYTDLLVIFIYVPSRFAATHRDALRRACWLLTYDWRGGDLLCRIVKFLHNFAFQSSSNVIVCIAIDRLLSVLSHAHNSPSRAHKRTRIMLSIAWTIAVIIAVPQFGVWRNYLAFRNPPWSQCLQIWEIARIELRRSGKTDNATQTLYSQLVSKETVYSAIHMSTVFWIPALIILLCYVVVLWWVWVNSRPSLSGSSLRVARGPSLPTALDSNDATQLTRASEWKPLKTFAKGAINHTIATEDASMPRIIVSDESCALSGQPPPRAKELHPRASITSTDAYAKAGAHMGNSQSYNARITRSKAIRVSFLLVVAYMVCWLPYNLMGVFRFTTPVFKDYYNMFYFLHELIVFNSVINPYLYGLFGNLRKPVSRNYD